LPLFNYCFPIVHLSLKGKIAERLKSIKDNRKLIIDNREKSVSGVQDLVLGEKTVK